MKFFLVIFSVLTVSSSRLVPVLRENLLKVDGILSIRLQFTNTTVGNDCREIHLTASPLYNVSLSSSGMVTLVTHLYQPVTSKISTKEDRIRFKIHRSSHFVELAINDGFKDLSTCNGTIFVEILQHKHCIKDTVYEKRFNETVHGFVEEDPGFQEGNTTMKGTEEVENDINILEEGFMVLARKDNDPEFLYIIVSISILSGLFFVPLAVLSYFDHRLHWKWYAVKQEVRMPSLNRADLEKKFPDEVSQFKGLVPQMHVAGMTEVQAAHFTYIGEEDRKILLGKEDDTQKTVTQSQGNSKASQGKESQTEIIPVNDVDCKPEKDQASKDSQLVVHTKELAERLAEKKRKKQEEERKQKQEEEERKKKQEDDEKKQKEEDRKNHLVMATEKPCEVVNRGEVVNHMKELAERLAAKKKKKQEEQDKKKGTATTPTDWRKPGNPTVVDKEVESHTKELAKRLAEKKLKRMEEDAMKKKDGSNCKNPDGLEENDTKNSEHHSNSYVEKTQDY